MLRFSRPLPSLALALCLVSPSLLAYDTDLSDTAVREAYFLGQRNDEKTRSFFEPYTRHLPLPKSGPHIASITMFTPYALAVLDSKEKSVGYSAQQAALDHAKHAESVRAILDILFTDTYGAYIPRPAGSRRDATTGLMPRPYDFWKDFQVNFFYKDDQLKPMSSSGQPKLSCDDYGCTLIGATLEFEFLAEKVPSDSITIQVIPPEGEQIVLDFDLGSVR
jgi:hypothetical protein